MTTSPSTSPFTFHTKHHPFGHIYIVPSAVAGVLGHSQFTYIKEGMYCPFDMKPYAYHYMYTFENAEDMQKVIQYFSQPKYMNIKTVYDSIYDDDY